MKDHLYLEKRAEVEAYFTTKNIRPSPEQIAQSPSGSFELKIYEVVTGAGARGYTLGIVKNLHTGSVICEIKRNFSRFWYAWVQHQSGYEYLLCGEDYQGYSVLNLNTAAYHVYFPEKGHNGVGFCWGDVHPSPDGLVLAVDGCYWGCPYELVIFDFKTPEELPLLEISRFSDLDVCQGWLDSQTFAFTRTILKRKADGQPYEQLSEQEQAVLDADMELVDEVSERQIFQRAIK